MGGIIKGVIIESKLLLDDDYNDLRPGSLFLFRALHFSLPHKGILFGEDLPIDKVNFLKEVAGSYSFSCFKLSNSVVDFVMNEIAATWPDVGKSIMLVLSSHQMDFCHKLLDHGYFLNILDVGGNTNNTSSINQIKKLEELPLRMCCFNKKVVSNEVMTVGYSMKPSRQADFTKLQEIDIILHKATDDIVSVELNSSLSPNITFTNGMEELRRALNDNPSCCVIDAFHNIYPVLDRLKIQHLLLGLEDLDKEGCTKIRGPCFLKVDSYSDPNLTEMLLEAKVSLPSIVKPQVACGVSSAHSMAIVFSFEDYRDLQVPLPAIIQEYVDHSSTLFKFYVLGEKVFHAVKKSTPNGDVLMNLSQSNQKRPLVFDSLKSLPTADKNQFGDESLELELVNNAANWLRTKLGLTIFGFDVVIQEGTGDHVIVDVNYLPSFKEVPDDVAIPAFWEAIKTTYRESRKRISPS